MKLQPSSLGAARRWAVPVRALLLSLLLLGPGLARASQVEIGQLEKELMNPCPNCGGKPLAGSYCGGAAAAKEELRKMVDEGMTHDQIVDAFVAEYGEWILAVPERRGFNLFAWIFPVVGMVLGGGGLALFLKRTNQARRQGGRSAPEPSESTEGSETAAAVGTTRVRGDREELLRRLEREVRED